MYKHLLLILASFITFTAIGQTTVNRKIALRYDEYANNAWQGKDSVVIQYNAFGKEWNRLSRRIGATTATWDHFYRTTSTFDGNGNETTNIRENWINGAWLNFTKYNYSYNSNNQRTDIIYQSWSTSTNTWSNTGRIVNTYNGNNLITKQESFSWNGSSWLPFQKQDYGYNAANELISKDIYSIVNSAYEGTVKYEYQYAFGFVSQIIESKYDPLRSPPNWYLYKRTLNLINGSATPPHLASSTVSYRDTLTHIWHSDTRSLYTYSNNLLTTIASDIYDSLGSAWKSYALTTNSYNGSNQLTEEIEQLFTTATASFMNNKKREHTYNANNLNDKITHYLAAGPTAWVESERDMYSYNANDSLIHSLNENYVNNAFVPNHQFHFYYANVPVGLNDVNNLFKQATLYPNPTSDNLHIQTNEKIDGAYVATIYSMTGKKVWSELNSSAISSLSFNVATLPVGNYILQISELNSGKTQQFKFGKQ